MKRLVITGPRQAVFDDVDMPVCAADGVVVKAKVTALSTGTAIWPIFKGCGFNIHPRTADHPHLHLPHLFVQLDLRRFVSVEHDTHY